MVYVFAGVAYEFCDSLWLSTFHGRLQWLTMATWETTPKGQNMVLRKSRLGWVLKVCVISGPKFTQLFCHMWELSWLIK